ncbi:UDP-glucosyltransferase 2-like isoform X2 [Schistocerca gregaria]|uniref:UDP-glucosyltransferase 2-like isoform X2 n=2 Tax=Schistocerca gregaria TaxID=7010 RepID=UPI00211EE8E7|nr:UDP-glucosyltransferase 2-like isoform X2 [Schistocerca gregaria]
MVVFRHSIRALRRQSPATMNNSLVLSFLLLLVLVHSSFASKILVVAPSPAISHQKPFHALTKALLQRGHEITFFTPNPLKLAHQNLTEIDLAPAYEVSKEVNFVDWAYMSPVETLNLILDLCYDVVRVQLSQPAVQDFIRRKPTFDLMIIERLQYQAYYGLAHLVGSPPLVGLVTMTELATVYHIYGSPMNPAYLPDLWVGLSDHMTFWQRLYNTYFYLRLYYKWFYEVIPKQEMVMREFFGTEPPPVYETEYNFSLLITNNDFSLEYARPLTPNIIEINGIHVPTKVEPLSEDVQKFLDGAEHGVIYFSLGSNVKSTNLPPQMIQDILQVFRQLPQRVLWKWENDSLPSQPENVMTRKWLQQPSVLAHPKVRLFIMQGGLQSLNEAAYHAVPLVVIPVFADQHHNAAKIAQSQIGVWLNIQDVTKDTFLRSIRAVLEDTKYKDNMKRLSAVFREHRAESEERAVWWVEYVIRHRGAPHLRSAALDLHWWQLVLLDVIAFVLAVAGLTLFAVYFVTRRVVSFFRGSKQKQKQKKQ